jgi:hypothetical protein
MSIRRVKVLLIIAAILVALTAIAWVLLEVRMTVRDVIVIFCLSAAIIISATAFMTSRGWLAKFWGNDQNKKK